MTNKRYSSSCIHTAHIPKITQVFEICFVLLHLLAQSSTAGARSFVYSKKQTQLQESHAASTVFRLHKLDLQRVKGVAGRLKERGFGDCFTHLQSPPTRHPVLYRPSCTSKKTTTHVVEQKKKRLFQDTRNTIVHEGIIARSRGSRLPSFGDTTAATTTTMTTTTKQTANSKQQERG